jgi:predicted DNA-binding antitoxin AbrB/MazE fold protein
MTRSFQALPLNLRAGEVVEVRSQEEILGTLDRKGELEALPFMPEMLQFCGTRFRVHRRAIKLCDSINWTGMHRMENAVHLEGLRCDGQAHGGCQAGCLLSWKEAWLKRVEPDAPDPAHEVAQPAAVTVPERTPRLSSSCTVDTLFAATRVDGGRVAPGDETFSCQATELMRAAPVRIPWWDPRQYLRDMRVGNARASAMIRYLTIMLFNKFQAANRRFLPRLPLIHGAKNYPFIDGQLTRTPKEVLNLQPGELVEVKSKEEIVRTLDKNNKNRGLKFDIEMLRYCGRRARVLRRVDHIIDEPTGKMMRFSNDCIILDGVACRSEYYGFCTRSTYPYWREIWLKRV